VTGAAAELERRYGIPDTVRFEAGPNGLVRALLRTPHAEAHVYLHGAHVTHYAPHGHPPVLFLSAQSRFEPGVAIRGGIPVVFPWFGARAGDSKAPAHGFARTVPWAVEGASRHANGSASLTLRLEATAATRRAWPHEFLARYRVEVGPALALGLEVVNRSAAAVAYEEALHTYLAVGDVRAVRIAGLERTPYLDKVDGGRRKVEGEGPVHLTGETDRVYLGTRATCVVDDVAGGRRLIVAKSGSETTVLWNPWAAKARALGDLGAEEWVRMLCLETANAVDHAVRLPPGGRHLLRAVIRAEAR